MFRAQNNIGRVLLDRPTGVAGHGGRGTQQGRKIISCVPVPPKPKSALELHLYKTPEKYRDARDDETPLLICLTFIKKESREGQNAPLLANSPVPTLRPLRPLRLFPLLARARHEVADGGGRGRQRCAPCVTFGL